MRWRQLRTADARRLQEQEVPEIKAECEEEKVKKKKSKKSKKEKTSDEEMEAVADSGCEEVSDIKEKKTKKNKTPDDEEQVVPEVEDQVLLKNYREAPGVLRGSNILAIPGYGASK